MLEAMKAMQIGVNCLSVTYPDPVVFVHIYYSNEQKQAKMLQATTWYPHIQLVCLASEL